MTLFESIEYYWIRHSVPSYEGYQEFCECHSLPQAPEDLYITHSRSLQEDWDEFCKASEAYGEFLEDFGEVL